MMYVMHSVSGVYLCIHKCQTGYFCMVCKPVTQRTLCQ